MSLARVAGARFSGPPPLALLLQIFGLLRVALDQRGERRVDFSARAESWQTADVLFHLRDGVENPPVAVSDKEARPVAGGALAALLAGRNIAEAAVFFAGPEAGFDVGLVGFVFFAAQ